MSTEREATHLISNSRECEPFSQVRGVGSVIFNTKNEILVGTEKIAKQAHHRQVGQISIPLETLKQFERTNKNALILAALSEITTEQNVDLLKEGLEGEILDHPVLLNEEGLMGAVAVFRWNSDLDQMPFVPSNSDEFDDLIWLSPDEFVDCWYARPYAATIVRHVKNNSVMNDFRGGRLSILDNFHPEKYTTIRESYPDVR